MKYLFAALLVLLVVASLGLRMSFPDLQAHRPVMYWVTDANPARELQVETFHKWLEKHGHVDEEGEPLVELRLDTGSSDTTKKVIQSVSGVAGDLMDTTGESMRLLQAMGVVADLTDDAEQMGFDVEQTYEAIRPALTLNGRQYRYPANVAVSMLWVNVDTLRRFGLEPPPSRWTWDDFEELGIKFKEAANPPGTPAFARRFLASDLWSMLMIRSAGISLYNETMTASGLDDPRYVDMLATKYRWIYELNILPTPDDRDAFSSAQGYGGASLQLFNSGQYAMVSGGRYMLIQLRRFENLGELKVVEPPYRELPTTIIASRAVVLYAGSKHPELAKLFLSYLASEDYNQLIIQDADALPPNPRYTQSEAFLKPPDYPNEWEIHAPFVNAANTIAIGKSLSPYILPTETERSRQKFEDFVMTRQMTPEEAAAATAREINATIAEEVSRKPELQDAYEADLKRQKRINELKDLGQPIPKSLITNPFHLSYYEQKGMLVDDTPAAETPEQN